MRTPTNYTSPDVEDRRGGTQRDWRSSKVNDQVRARREAKQRVMAQRTTGGATQDHAPAATNKTTRLLVGAGIGAAVALTLWAIVAK